MQHAVSPAVKDQWLASGMAEIENLADKDDVIAALVLISPLAREAGHAVLQHRNTVRPAIESKTTEPIDALARKARRQRFLIGRQDMHCEMRAVAESVDARGCPRKAPENHRRIERHGGKAVRRQTDVGAGWPGRGDNRHACGERAKRVPQ